MELKKLSSSKINPTKLLGASSFVKNTTNIAEDLKEESITISKSDLSTIKGQVFEIKNLVTSLTTLKKKKLKTERLETERQKFGEREKELEKKKKPEDNKIKFPEVPKLGFLDIIKRFVVNTLIGFVAVRLIKHLPKLIEVAKFVGGAMDFITNVGGNLLNGLATFVQKGYEAYDFTRNTLKSFGGENALKLFDGFNNALGGIVTAALAASFALFDMAGGDSGGPGRGRGEGGRSKTYHDGFFRRGDTRSIEKRLQGNNTNLYKNRTLQQVDDAIMKRYFQKYGRDAFVKRFGEEGLKRLPGGMQRGLLQKGARSAFVGLAGKGGVKAVLKFTRPFLKKLPIIGAVLDFGLSVALGEDPGRAAFKAIGAGLLGTIGAALGGPFALLTGLAGGAIGDAAGATLYDLFFGNKKPNQKVAKAAGGGQPVTRAGKVVSGPKRTIKKSKAKRTVSVQSTQLKPGSDIGGEKNIEKVFPKGKTGEISPLDYIEKSYKNTEQDRLFGPLLNLQTKSLVGQKPNKVDYKNAAQGLSNWMTLTFSDEILRTGAVYAAGGGEINTEMLSRKSGDMTDAIAKSLEDSISKRLDDNIQDLMKQMMLKEPTKELDKSDPTLDIDEEVPSGLTEGQWGPLLDLIAGKESGGNYEAMYPSTTLPGATKMTIAEVARRATGAVGKYQQLPQYLVGRAKSAGLNPDKDLYSPENQEKIIINVNIKGRGGEKWLKGEISDEQFMQGLSQEFASLPNAQGKFYYPGQRSAMTPEKVKAALSKVKKGGYSQKEIASSKMQQTSGTGKFKVIEYITGDRNHPNLDIPGHGMPGNYHDHIAFATIQEKERAKNALRSSGIQIGSELRPGDPGYHGRNLAIDIPGAQWGGSGAIGNREFAGSRRVRSVLGIGNIAPRFHGGFISKDAKYFLHKGEYVVDADSVNTVGQSFIATINSIENQSQLKQKVGSLINHLSYIADYEPGGHQEIEVEMPEPQIVSVPMPVPIAGGTTVISSSSSGEDYSQALYAQG
jgi:hypothetical protein